MTEHELVGMVAESAQVSRDQARRVIDALADIIRGAVRDGDPPPLSTFGAFCSPPCQAWATTPRPAPANPDDPPPPLESDDYHPTQSEVDRVISRARKHRLGLEFLLRGEPSAVASVLETHVFTVEAARKRLEAS